MDPFYADNLDVEWSSDNPLIVEVDNNGKVTAKSEGTAVITVTTVDGGYKASCAVTVIDPTPQPEIVYLNVSPLGGVNSTLGSAYSTSTNRRYTSSEVNANSSIIDWIYYYNTSRDDYPEGHMVFSPASLWAREYTTSWSNMEPKRGTKFKVVDDSAFNYTNTNAELEALAKDFSNNEDGFSATNLKSGSVVVFKTDDGRLGLFKVDGVSTASGIDVGNFWFTVKIQKFD